MNPLPVETLRHLADLEEKRAALFPKLLSATSDEAAARWKVDHFDTLVDAGVVVNRDTHERARLVVDVRESVADRLRSEYDALSSRIASIYAEALR